MMGEINYRAQKLHIQSLLPTPNKTLMGFPSLSQCIGTKRLWSSLLGKAFYIDSCKSMDIVCLEKIAYLSRTYLVIDDYIKDEEIDPLDREFCQQWLLNIGLCIRRYIKKLGGDEKEFIEQLAFCDKAFNERQSKSVKDVLNNAIDKCKIFFNPYKLISIYLKTEVRGKRIIYLESFFKICQALDDFCDIEEDSKKKVNQNIFMHQISNSDHLHLLRVRPYIAPTLLRSAQLLLNKFNSFIEGDNNIVFSTYHLHALKWLKWKQETITISGSYDYDLFDFHSWKFGDDQLQKFQDMKANSQIVGEINDIRPEFMQSYFLGAKTLQDF